MAHNKKKKFSQAFKKNLGAKSGFEKLKELLTPSPAKAAPKKKRKKKK